MNNRAGVWSEVFGYHEPRTAAVRSLTYRRGNFERLNFENEFKFTIRERSSSIKGSVVFISYYRNYLRLM